MNHKERKKIALIKFYLWSKKAETKKKFLESKDEISRAVYNAEARLLNEILDLVEELPDE